MHTTPSRAPSAAISSSTTFCPATGVACPFPAQAMLVEPDNKIAVHTPPVRQAQGHNRRDNQEQTETTMA